MIRRERYDVRRIMCSIVADRLRFKAEDRAKWRVVYLL